MHCYYCNTIVNARNRSCEHILPNAIGGKLKSYRLLCRSCNELLGKTVDAALAAHFHDLCKSIGVQRERPVKPLPSLIDKVTFDETDLLKAIAKIAINSYLHWGGSRSNITQILSFLKGEIPHDNLVHQYIPSKPTNEVSHVIHLIGNRAAGTLYADIVLFSSYGFIANLSDDFSEESFSRTYQCDVLRNEPIGKQA